MKTLLQNKSSYHVQCVKDQNTSRILTLAPMTQMELTIQENDINNPYYPYESVTWKTDKKANHSGFLKVQCKERKDVKKIERPFPTIRIDFQYGSPTWSIRLADYSVFGTRGIPQFLTFRGIDLFTKMAEHRDFINRVVIQEIPDSSYPGGLRIRESIESKMDNPREKEDLKKLNKMREQWRLQRSTDAQVTIK